MKIRKQLYLVACLSAALFLSSCSASEKKAVPEELKNYYGKTLTYDVWGCKTVLTQPPLVGDQNVPIKDCGDFTTSNNRLPRDGEPGFANTQKVGQLRIKIEGNEEEITDVYFGVDDQYLGNDVVTSGPPKSTYLGVFKTIIEDAASQTLDTKGLHSLKKVVSETGHSPFWVNTTSYGQFPVLNSPVSFSNEENAVNIDLKLKTLNNKRFQWIRFRLEIIDNKVAFTTLLQMEYDPNNALLKPILSIDPVAIVRDAGGSVEVSYWGISTGNNVDLNTGTLADPAWKENKLGSYQRLGGPEFRFASSD